MVSNAKDIGPSYTAINDSRITFVGKILRKLHIDETPQFINILKGELSFVGPRPEEVKLAREYEKNIPYYSIRYLIKPGVTGWAQINYVQSTTLAEAQTKLEYDFYYLKSGNSILDLVIILKTLRVALEMNTN
jgi:lipopolysaccharide/colanic/teichoic acid biosynthesis glycosyltransferase